MNVSTFTCGIIEEHNQMKWDQTKVYFSVFFNSNQHISIFFRPRTVQNKTSSVKHNNGGLLMACRTLIFVYEDKWSHLVYEVDRSLYIGSTLSFLQLIGLTSRGQQTPSSTRLCGPGSLLHLHYITNGVHRMTGRLKSRLLSFLLRLRARE